MGVFDIEALVIPDDYVQPLTQEAIDQTRVQGIQFVEAGVGLANEDEIVQSD
jgi:hypothetical protein